MKLTALFLFAFLMLSSESRDLLITAFSVPSREPGTERASKSSSVSDHETRKEGRDLNPVHNVPAEPRTMGNCPRFLSRGRREMYLKVFQDTGWGVGG